MLVSLTVGKVDAGMAVLLTEDKRIIEFPSILLPPDISTGSIVDITVTRNHTTESAASKAFTALQSEIYNTFGLRKPKQPVLRCRNATQTSVVLEWDPIDLATSSLRSLDLYRDGVRVGVIPRARDVTSTKISGLAIDSEYRFQLMLRTSAGVYPSEELAVRTHALTDLTGITVTPGVMPAALRESLAATVARIGAKMIDTVRIDTTHFVCVEPRGQAWERAVESNIPVVVPDWVKGCEAEGRIVGVRQYYLDADPRLRTMPNMVTTSGPGQQARPSTPPQTPSTKVTPPTPETPSMSEPRPAVPPKDDRNGSVAGETIAEKAGEEESDEESETADDSTLAETAPEGKGKGKAAKDESDSEAEDDDQDEWPGSSAKKEAGSKPEAAKSEHKGKQKHASVEDEKEDDASFQDVTL